ncbi:hypothetical protein HDV62DRAFT_136492 [Trichoderma sp. SZMC 28011]
MLSKPQLPFLKAKTNSSVTSFENLRLSTELFEMTRTKPVRTVVRLDIANMIVPSDKTTPPASSVESVAMPAIWLEIVRTAREVPIGAMMRVVLDLQVGSEVAMLLIVKWRYVAIPSPHNGIRLLTPPFSNSCKNSAAAPELPQRRSRPAQAATTTMETAKRSHGNEDLLVDPRPGDPATKTLMTEAIAEALRLLGHAIATAATRMATATVTAAKTTTMDNRTMALHLEERPRGTNRLTRHRSTRLLEWVGMPTTLLRTVPMALHLVWVRLLVSPRRVLPVYLLPQVLVLSMLSSSSTQDQHRRLLLLPEMLLLLLRAISPLRLLPLARNHWSRNLGQLPLLKHTQQTVIGNKVT